MVAREEEVVIGEVKAVRIDNGDGVWAVDLGVGDGLEMSGGVTLGPEAEDFNARASLRVVDQVEIVGLAVILDA